MRAVKIAAVTAAAVPGLVAGAALAPWLYGGLVLAWALQHPISAVIGRQIRIDGPLVVRWRIATHIVAETVQVDLHGTFSDPIYHFRRGELMRRLGEALGLGVFFPPAAVVPLVGLGEDNLCSRAFPAQ
jgi:hypothetical protein